MEVPPEIAFRNVEPTPALEEKIVDGIRKLEEVNDRIVACRIAVEVPNPRHRKGNRYRVRIDVTVPGHEIVVDRAPPAHRENEDPVRAVGEAFDRVRSQLVEHRDRIRNQVKHHEEQPRGKVRSLFHGEGYGFIESTSGEEVYFHENSVLDGAFHRLEEGSEVRFVAEMGEEGLQASTVVLVRPAREGG